MLGSLTALAYIAMPLGSVLGGLALERIDIRLLLVGLGSLYLATILAAMLIPAMRQMNVRPAPAAGGNPVPPLT